MPFVIILYFQRQLLETKIIRQSAFSPAQGQFLELELSSRKSATRGLRQQFLLFLCLIWRDRAELRSQTQLGILLSARGSLVSHFGRMHTLGSSDLNQHKRRRHQCHKPVTSASSYNPSQLKRMERLAEYKPLRVCKHATHKKKTNVLNIFQP